MTNKIDKIQMPDGQVLELAGGNKRSNENNTLSLFYNLYSSEDIVATGAYVNALLGS